MTTEQNKQIALDWLVAFQTADIARLRELSHEDFQHIVWGDMPFSRYRNFDEFLQHPAELELGQYFEGPIKMTVGRIVGEGDRVYLEAESFAPLKGGKLYNNLYIWSFDIEDGKVRLVKELHDTLHTYRALDSQHIRGPAKQRVNVLFDEPTHVIDAASGDDSALAMPAAENAAGSD